MEYRNLELTETPLIRELFASYYDPQVYCVEPRYFEWLHARSPMHALGAEPGEATVLAAIDGDRLMGCICYVPTTVHVDGREHTAVVTTESLARPEASGVYGLLARRLVGRFDYCFMMGATEQLRDLYVRLLRAEYRHDMSRWLLIGELDALATVLARAPEPSSADPRELEAWAGAARQLAGAHPVHVLGREVELSDRYWQAQLASGRASLRRDPAWIDWRYRRHPHIDYVLVSTDAEQRGGLAVLRRERPRGLECHAMRLLEFLPTPGRAHALAGAVANLAVGRGCAMLDFFCAHEDWDELLPPAFVRPAAHHGHAIPYLLQPPEWRARHSINLLSVRNRAKRHELSRLGGGSIYLTKGDGGQDIALDEGYRSAHLRKPS